jgi:hypothetical protein
MAFMPSRILQLARRTREAVLRAPLAAFGAFANSFASAAIVGIERDLRLRQTNDRVFQSTCAPSLSQIKEMGFYETITQHSQLRC